MRQAEILFFIFLIVLVPLPVYGESHVMEDVTNRGNFTVSYNAEEIEPETNREVHSAIDAIFDAIGEFGKVQTESTDWFDDEKKEQINIMTDSGVSTGKTAIQLFWDFHHFIVNIVFAGSPVPFDIGIAVMISFILSIVIVAFLFKDFIRKSWKIFAVLGIIIAIILISGIQAPSI